MICSCALAAAEKPALKPADLLNIRQVSQIDISHDGKNIAFVVTEPPTSASRTRQSTLWTVSVSGDQSPAPVKTDFSQISEPHWSPDGTFLAFLSVARTNPPAGKKQITLLHVKDGTANHVTSAPAGVEKFSWSPDGRFIAFLANRALNATQEKGEEPGSPVEADLHSPLSALWILNGESGKAVPITQERHEVNDFCWSPDGSQLALRVSDSSFRDDEFWHSRLIIIERSTGRTVRSLSEAISPWEGTLEWSPDGKLIAFPEFTPRKIASWLTLSSVTDQHDRHLATDYPGTVKAERWSPDSRSLIAEAMVGTKAKIIRIDATTGAVAELDTVLANNASSASFSVSSSGNTIAYLCAKPDAPVNICVLDVGKGSRQLTNFHEQLANFRIGRAQEITWKSRSDGRTVYGVLYLPPDYKPGQTRPAVVLVHGGPMEVWATGWNNWADLLASNGYVVLLPNPRGSEGNGWRFTEANFNDWGGGDFQDIMDGVDQLITDKIADPDRLGIAGRSFGGFMTAWAITQTTRFKAAVVGAGITNLLSFHAQASVAPTFLQTYFGGYPFEKWATYERHSPVYFIGKVKTPTLIMHGSADDVVPESQSWELYRGLKMTGTETKLILYPGEWHVLGQPAHQIDEMTRMLSWMDQHLK